MALSCRIFKFLFLIFFFSLPASYAVSGNLRSKRKPEMDTYGFHGDTFSGGFGDFHPAKKRNPYELPFAAPDGFGSRQDNPFYQQFKRRHEMDTNGFHGDTFSSGFGNFYPAKRSNAN
eukprot:TRINITY_DN19755_c0_g1_i1.p1 TRINITY_DN19755_c0_g1~~TRINITY_DN19755_c0_g1_i1.p1  ORF type:complete len:129 (-),score=21.01 TRINITY_DN19755_c0_g1_i1:203-556(-)